MTTERMPGEHCYRDAVYTLEKYVAGYTTEQVQRELGLTDVVKLASNENAWGPSPKALEAIGGELHNLWQYPEQSFFDLKHVLAEVNGVSAENVVVGHGTEVIIQLIPQLFCEAGDDVVVADLTYGRYAEATKLMNAAVRVVPLRDFHYDLDAVRAAVGERTKLVWICSPNNPTGCIVRRDEIDDFMASLPAGVTVVFDQAYREFVDDPDYADGLDLLKAGRENVIVLRTFSKAYGLAGMRLGYALVPPRVCSLLDTIKEPFNLNRLSIVAGPAALSDTEWLHGLHRADHRGPPPAHVHAHGVGLRRGAEPGQLRPRRRRRERRGALGAAAAARRHRAPVHRLGPHAPHARHGRPPRAERALPRGVPRGVAGARRAGRRERRRRAASPAARPSWTCCATCAPARAGAGRHRAGRARVLRLRRGRRRRARPAGRRRLPALHGRGRARRAGGRQYRRPVYTRGAGTNLSGGTTPVDGGLVLCLLEMDEIVEIDAVNLTATVQPGVIIKDLDDAAAASSASCTRRTPARWPSPPWAAAWPSAPAACAASSTASPRTTSWASRSCSPTAACCAPAARREERHRLRPRQAHGRHEGTLGIITEITVKLRPRPEAMRSMLAYFDTRRSPPTRPRHRRRRRDPRHAGVHGPHHIVAVEGFTHVGLPRGRRGLLLIEVDGIPEVVGAREAATVLEAVPGPRRRGQGGRMGAERDRLWAARRAALPAARLRPTIIVEDATVPRSQISAMLDLVGGGAKHDLSISVVGHAGDGNLHPRSSATRTTRWRWPA